MKDKTYVSAQTARRVLYFVTVIFSVAFLYAGNRLAMQSGGLFPPFSDPSLIKAKVISISNREVKEQQGFTTTDMVQSVHIQFFAQGLEGTHKGETLLAEQVVDGMFGGQMEEIEVGDKVSLYLNPDPMATTTYAMGDYLRSDGLMVFCLVFLAMLLVFGRMKGFHTILSLLFTCAAVFVVFVPMVLAGYNIYYCAVMICIYTVVSTLLLVNGATTKTLTAIIGCAAGVFASGAITLLMTKLLKLSGLVSQETQFLLDLGIAQPIDLKGVVFAAIIIGAMGAVMDVAMSVASALAELADQAAVVTVRSLFRSGMNIGRDMMSTMANTLVLAYIGSSLASVLLLAAYAKSVLELVNREMIVTEIVQAVTGSMAILLTIPLTSLVAAVLYTRKPKTPDKEAIQE